MRNIVKIPMLLFAVTLLIGATTSKTWAQGPVQPEAMQFEPVDVTDVVNLATGDFVYTVPLMNVPGPDGDFPIVLSYHSGIGPNQPATWVGLGWTLNPGAINRTLSGYPDDYKGDLVITTYNAASQSGGALSLGAGWGPVGLNMSYDTESGKVGVNAMVSVFGALDLVPGVGNLGDLGKGFNADINASIGTSGVSATASLQGSRSIGGGKGILSGGISAGSAGVGINAGVATAAQSHTVSLDGNGVDYRAKYGALSAGASLTSHGMGGSFSVAGTGFTTMTTSGGGSVEMESQGIKIPLPGNFWVSLGRSKWKWTLDEKNEEYSYGVLYQTDNMDGSNRTSTIKNERHTTEEVLFPSKDAYNVAAQGVSGAFLPMFDYTYELVDQVDNDKKGNLDRTYITEAASNNITQTSANFRFLDDTGLNFTNKGNLTDFSTAFDYSQILTDEYSSKKIEPVIAANTGKIMGFKITMPDGMIYEFMQPVLNYYQYSETKSNLDATPITNKNSLLVPYATSWLLTAIKGPDYVDRSPTNSLTDGDWGYWVKINYREYMPKIWRAPYIGKAMGTDGNSEYFSLGVRQDIQLESIETKTHIAKFEKSFSKNGKSANEDLNDYDYQINPYNESVQLNAHTFEGDNSWLEEYVTDTDVIYTVTHYSQEFGQSVRVPCNSESFTKDEISIVYNEISNVSSVYFEPGVSVSYNCPGGATYNSSDGTIILSSYISTTATAVQLDKATLNLKNSGSSTIYPISNVEFDYDYSLRGNSSGSIASSNDGVLRGSLTLKTLSFLGRFNEIASPPYRFDYAYGNAPGGSYNPHYNNEHYDLWGSFRFTEPGVSVTTHKNLPQQEKGKADLAAAWSLTGIKTPTGSELEIEYESDDFFFVNNTFYLADGQIGEINESSSTGNNLVLVNSFTEASLKSETILISEKEITTGIGGCQPGYGCAQVNKEKYNFVGQFSVQSVDEANKTLVLEGNIPQFKSSYSPKPGLNRIYNYYMVSLPEKVYGGGSRVKTITTRNGRESVRTLYTYTDGSTSSGVTPTLPADYSEIGTDTDIDNQLGLVDEYESVFMDHEDSYGRPNPGVIYSKVQVLNVDENMDPISGMTEYEFYTARDYPYTPNTSSSHFYIEDRSGIYGKPKSVTYYEQYVENNAIEFRPLKRTESLYAFSDELFFEANIYKKEPAQVTEVTDANTPLGVTQQKHASYIAISGGGTSNDHAKIVERTYFNVFGIGQKSTEYFYDNPVSSAPSSELVAEGKTIGYDAHTGSGIITAQQSSSNSETVVSETVPAWWQYSTMKDKNMLTQVFQATNYRVPLAIDDATLKDDFDTGQVLSSSITTWYPWYVTWDNQEIWRKNDTYSYISDYPYVDFPQVDPGSANGTFPSVTASFPWKKTSDIVQYDDYGHVIETVNSDGTYQSVIYDDNNNNQSLVLAVASNARLEEIAYYNYEWFGSQPSSNRYTGLRSTTSHTVTSPNVTPLFGSKYKIGIWVRGSSATVDGLSVPGANNSSWVFYTKLIDPNTSVTVANGTFDDITIIPEYASISYFSYNQITWDVEAITGPDHRTIFYEYDDAGRLTGVRDQDKNLIQTTEYSYGHEHFINTDKVRYAIGEEVNFDLIALRSGITASTDYTWTFGDGVGLETTGVEATHTYSSGGEYIVSVSFTDSENITRRSNRTIKVGDAITGDISILRIIDYGVDDLGGGLIVDEPDGSSESYISVQAMANIQGGIAPYEYEWYLCTTNTQVVNGTCTLMDGEDGASAELGKSVTNDGTPTTLYALVVVTDYIGTTFSVNKEAHNLNGPQ